MKNRKVFCLALVCVLLLCSSACKRTNQQETDINNIEESQEDSSSQDDRVAVASMDDGSLTIDLNAVNQMDWLETHGYQVTPQGDFTLQTMLIDEDNVCDAGLMDIPTQVYIEESTEGMEDGYKTITFTAYMDMTGHGEYGYLYNEGSFDRYTGITFPEDYLDVDKNTASDSAQLEYDGKTYNIVIYKQQSFDPSTQIATFQKYIVCPEFYDGVVFYLGYSDVEIMQTEGVDFCVPLEQTTCFDMVKDKLYFFTVNNK